ncbi:tRNA modification GTPase gtpbp3, mitochondrial [Podila epicladia]|nr:tRNA modification GTPase gtpbp3, mitochondrial [Podila epicladia]
MVSKDHPGLQIQASAALEPEHPSLLGSVYLTSSTLDSTPSAHIHSPPPQSYSSPPKANNYKLGENEPVYNYKTTTTTSPSEHPDLHPEDQVVPSDAPTITPPESRTTPLISSAVSVLSASGTLVPPTIGTRPNSNALRPEISQTTTGRTLDDSLFDADRFKALLKDLTTHTEILENLNEQALDSLTEQESCLALLHDNIEKERTSDLERARQRTAQTFKDLVAAAWPELHRSAEYQRQHGQMTPKQAKQLTKMATQLKQSVTTFWDLLDRYQECAQLIADVYQDPDLLEQEDSVGTIRILRSRHLNNLLGSSLCSSEAMQLAAKCKEDQDRMAVITEQFHSILLGLVVLLDELAKKKLQTQQTSKGTKNGMPSDEGAQESLGSKIARLGRNKKQAFKAHAARHATPSTQSSPTHARWIHHSQPHHLSVQRTQLQQRQTSLDPTSSRLRYTNTHLDTIFALSTHPGKAGIAVIRVSGPQARSVLRKMTSSSSAFPKPRTAVTRRLLCPLTNELLDKGMAIWFPGPRSFTGEDSVEFHCHGGKAVVDGVLRAIGDAGEHIRLAEPGEFARRAFENDKLDLTEVEGLADLLNAETEAQRRLALRQADGGLKNLYDNWRTQLIQSMALVEALIDFGEDENIEDDVYDNVVSKIQSLHSEIKSHMDDDRRGEILRDGIHVTILGPPNAGKSSFLNYITKRQAAIVSPIPGTTRDVVEVSLDIGGYPVLIGDTAGLRRSEDEIEMQGVQRAHQRISLADINIAILPITDFSIYGQEESSVDEMVLQAIRENPNTMVLINKMDLSHGDVKAAQEMIRSSLWPDSVGSDDGSKYRVWAISCQTGEGIGTFLKDFIHVLKDRFESTLTSSTSITQYRHRVHLENCLHSLDVFLRIDHVVLGAEELRHAATDLGRITGRVDVEEVLDVVFREFCIGK